MRHCPRCNSRYEDAVGFCPRDGTGLEELKDSLIGEEVGHYKITSLIGEGGMGAVYLAVHPGIGSRVAVKVLHPELARDRAAVDRFFSEARSVNLIHHENIVNILDLAQLADGRSYIVMEYLEGESVAARLRKKGPFAPKDAAKLMLPVLGALQAAHEHGIIHRDLKPDNIFLTRGGQVKVLDFGIAKLDVAHGGGSATRTGAILGTPMYMSPEQAAGRASQVDHRSDIYSAGIILHELCAGKVPFISDALYDLITKHLTEPPTPLRQLKPEVPPELEALVLRALAKERDQRFPTAAAMAEALQAVLDVSAARPVVAAGAAALATAATPAVAGPVAPTPSGPLLPAASHTPSYASPPTPVPPTFAPPPSGYVPTAAGPPPAYPATPPTAAAFPPPGTAAAFPPPPGFGTASGVRPPPAALPVTTPALSIPPGPPPTALPPGTLGPAPPPYRRPAGASSKGGVALIAVVLVVGGLVLGYRMGFFSPPKHKAAAADAGTATAAEQSDAAAVIPIGTVDAGPEVKVAVKGGKVTGQASAEEEKRREAQKEEERKKKEKEKKKGHDVPLPPDVGNIDDVYRRLGKQKPLIEKAKALDTGLSGNYAGRIFNTTVNARTGGRLQLEVRGSRVTGYLYVDPPFGGTGPVTGTAEGNKLQLTVRSREATIHMTGAVLGKTVTGVYTASGPLVVPPNQRGTFTMRKP